MGFETLSAPGVGGSSGGRSGGAGLPGEWVGPPVPESVALPRAPASWSGWAMRRLTGPGGPRAAHLSPLPEAGVDERPCQCDLMERFSFFLALVIETCRLEFVCK